MTDEQIATGMDQMRDELVNQRRDRFFSGYMAKAKEKLKIEINQDTLARAIGRRPRAGAALPRPVREFECQVQVQTSEPAASTSVPLRELGTWNFGTCSAKKHIRHVRQDLA